MPLRTLQKCAIRAIAMLDYTVTATVESLKSKGKQVSVVWVSRPRSALFDVYLCERENHDLRVIADLGAETEVAGYLPSKATFMAMQAGADHKQTRVVGRSQSQLIFPTGRKLYVA